jgi:hypothetical protein
LAKDTILNKADRILRDEMKLTIDSAKEGRDFEKFISESLLKNGTYSNSVSFNNYDFFDDPVEKKINKTYDRIEFDRIFQKDLIVFKQKVPCYFVVESKVGSKRKLSGNEVWRFIDKLKTLKRFNIIPIIISKKDPSSNVKALCNDFGIGLFTKEMIK